MTIPIAPVWSVHGLLSSYLRPHVSDGLLKKLNDLSALIPPEEWTEAHAKLKGELEEMKRLVGAVKLLSRFWGIGFTHEAGAKDNVTSAIPDGRIWSEGVGMTLPSNTCPVEFENRLQSREDCGADLIKYANITKDGFYVVEADRRKK